MIWLSWRQVRLQALMGTGFVALVALVAVITGRTLHDLVATVPNVYDALDPSDTAPPLDPCLERLAAAGYEQRLAYQPADRFWPLQLREAALFAAVGGLMIGLAVWWTRARLV